MPDVHDMGGWHTDGPIDKGQHQWMDWEWQTHVLPGVLGKKNLIVVDEMRRGIESMPKEKYEASSYYERWASSIETILVEKNVLTTEEIDAKVKEIEKRWE